MGSVAIPRKTQVLVVLALGWQALQEREKALFFAREAADVAGTSSFRYWSLVALGIVATLADEPEATNARDAARAIAHELCDTVPAPQRHIFRESPLIQPLLTPTGEE